MLYKINNPYISVYQTTRERLQQAGANNYIILTSRLTVTIETSADRRCKNVLTSNKVSLILLDAAAAKTSCLIILAAYNSKALYCINAIHLFYMLLHYVLMFLHRDRSQNPRMLLYNNNETCIRNKLTQQVYYQYYLHTYYRATLVPFLYYRLFQQYLVNIQVILNQSRLLVNVLPSCLTDWGRLVAGVMLACQQIEGIRAMFTRSQDKTTEQLITDT